MMLLVIEVCSNNFSILHTFRRTCYPLLYVTDCDLKSVIFIFDIAVKIGLDRVQRRTSSNSCVNASWLIHDNDIFSIRIRTVSNS